MVEFLAGAGTENLITELAKNYSLQESALAELAIRTNLLLLVYTPKGSQWEPMVPSLSLSAAESGLPPEYWQELLDLLAKRASFAEVKEAVLRLHQDANEFLLSRHLAE